MDYTFDFFLAFVVLVYLYLKTESDDSADSPKLESEERSFTGRLTDADMAELTTQEVVVDRWRTAFQETVGLLRLLLGNNTALDRWDNLAADLPENCRLFSPDQVRKTVAIHMRNLKPYLTHTPTCGLSKNQHCDCGLDLLT